MITPEIVLNALLLPPKKAVEYMNSKDLLVTLTARQFEDMSAAIHAEAFTMAGVTRLSILQDVHDDLNRAMEQGLPFADFKKTFKERMAKRGWMPKADQAKFTPFRMETIYRTNTHSAYNAGRIIKQKQVVSTRPWWRYNAVVDKQTSSGCNGLDGKVARYDDPFWSSNYPPRHYRCRGSVSTLSDRELKRDGYEVASSEELANIQPAHGFGGQPDAGYKPDLSKFNSGLVKEYKKGLKK